MTRIDRLISRYAFSQSLGLWDFAAYFLADTRTTAISLASIYKGIVTGGEDGGQIFLEGGIFQEKQITAIYEQEGFTLVEILKDYGGINRCIILKK